jgi:hypothetical protein
MSFELGPQISEGSGHKVYLDAQNPGKLVKIPKSHFPGISLYDQAQRDLDLALEHFGPWIPETNIYPDSQQGYVIHQRKVSNAEHITPAHLESFVILDALEEILEANRKAIRDANVGIDIIGYEGSAKCFLYNFRRYRNTPLDILVITPSLRVAQTTSNSVPQKCLEWWQDPELTPEITNLLLGVRGNVAQQVAFVDLSLLHFQSSSPFERFRATFLHSWNSFFLEKNFKISL